MKDKRDLVQIILPVKYFSWTLRLRVFTKKGGKSKHEKHTNANFKKNVLPNIFYRLKTNL